MFPRAWNIASWRGKFNPRLRNSAQKLRKYGKFNAKHCAYTKWTNTEAIERLHSKNKTTSIHALPYKHHGQRWWIDTVGWWDNRRHSDNYVGVAYIDETGTRLCMRVDIIRRPLDHDSHSVTWLPEQFTVNPKWQGSNPPMLCLYHGHDASQVFVDWALFWCWWFMT